MSEQAPSDFDAWFRKVINFLEIKQAYYGAHTLTRQERTVHFANFVDAQIGWDGIDGFFLNFLSDIPLAGVESLREIGCIAHADILQKSLHLVPAYKAGQGDALAQDTEIRSVKEQLSVLSSTYFDIAGKSVDSQLSEFAKQQYSSFPPPDKIDLVLKDLSAKLSQKSLYEKQEKRDKELQNARRITALYEEILLAAAGCLRSLGKRNDFSLASLWGIANLLERFRQTRHFPEIFGNDVKGFELMLSAYTGEVVRRAKGGQWAALPILPEYEVPAIEIPGSQPFFPGVATSSVGNESLIDYVRRTQGIEVGPQPQVTVAPESLEATQKLVKAAAGSALVTSAKMRVLHYQGDFSTQSLWDVVDAIERYASQGKSPCQDLDADDFSNILALYTGELLRRAKGGRWAVILEGDTPATGIAFDDGVTVAPFILIAFLKNGTRPVQRLITYAFEKLGIDAGPKPMSTPPRRKFWEW